MRRIAQGELTLDAITKELNALHKRYDNMAAAYAFDVLSSLMGYAPSKEEVDETIAAAENILKRMRQETEADRERDAGLDMMVGYGYDFRDEGEQVADFLNTR